MSVLAENMVTEVTSGSEDTEVDITEEENRATDRKVTATAVVADDTEEEPEVDITPGKSGSEVDITQSTTSAETSDTPATIHYDGSVNKTQDAATGTEVDITQSTTTDKQVDITQETTQEEPDESDGEIVSEAIEDPYSDIDLSSPEETGEIVYSATPKNEEEFGEYVENLFGDFEPNHTEFFSFKAAGARAGTRGDTLTTTANARIKKAYDVISEQAKSIANGDSASSVIRVTYKELGLGESEWVTKTIREYFDADKKDLVKGDAGYDEAYAAALVKAKNAAVSEAKTAYLAKFDMGGSTSSGVKYGNLLLSALISDLPYELYWYNKTASFCYGPTEDRVLIRDVATYSKSGTVKARVRYITGTVNSSGKITREDTENLPGLYYLMPVAESYSTGVKTRVTFSTSASNTTESTGASAEDYYTANTTKTSAAKSALANAETVLETAKSKDGDVAKMETYADYIMDQVSYNNTAWGSTGSAQAYGDPWQLIYVFDNNPETNVVCEGYSKAFQYLCDNTEFTGQKTCSNLVTGYLGEKTDAKRHMWNLVKLQVGSETANYFVDITNMENVTPKPAAENPLFLFGVTLDSVGINGDTWLKVSTDSSRKYLYDSDTKEIFTSAELTVSTSRYSKTVHEHSYEGVYTWTGTETGYTCTVTPTCATCGDQKPALDMTVTGPVTIASSSCLVKDTLRYTAKYPATGETRYSSTKDVEGESTGNTHTFTAAPTYTWNKTVTPYTCKAKFVCSNCSHEETVNMTVTSAQTKRATCTETGTLTYTARCTVNGTNYSTTETAAIAKTAHTLAAVNTYRWNSTKNLTEQAWQCSVCKGADTAVWRDSGRTFSVNSVTLDTTAVSLNLNANRTATVHVASVVPYYADPRVVWESANPTVATVSDQGVITAVGNGNTIIAASSRVSADARAYVQVNVTGGTAVTGMKLYKASASTFTAAGTGFKMLSGETITLSPQLTPVNATETPAVTWASSNEDVVSLKEKTTLNSSEGILYTLPANGGGNVATAKNPGTAVITAKVNGTIQAEVTITVDSYTQAVAISPKDSSALTLTTGKDGLKHGELTEGSYVNLTALISPANSTDDRSITWKSDNAGVLKVSASGLLQAVKAYDTEVRVTATAKTSNGQKTVADEVWIRVKALQNPAVQTDPSFKATLNKTTVQLTYKQMDDSGKNDIRGNNVAVTLSVPTAMAPALKIDWSFEGSDVFEFIGEKPTVFDANGRAVVTINAKKTPGTGYLVASVKNGSLTNKAACKVVVTKPMTGISIDKSQLTLDKGVMKLKYGQSAFLSAIPYPADTTETGAVSWKSTQSYVKAYAGGRIYASALTQKDTYVQAYVGSVKSELLQINVTGEPTALLTNKTDVTINTGGSYVLKASLLPAGLAVGNKAANTKWTLTSSDPLIRFDNEAKTATGASVKVVTGRNYGGVKENAQGGAYAVITATYSYVGEDGKTYSLQAQDCVVRITQNLDSIELYYDKSDIVDFTNSKSIADYYGLTADSKTGTKATVSKMVLGSIKDGAQFCTNQVTAPKLATVVYTNPVTQRSIRRNKISGCYEATEIILPKVQYIPDTATNATPVTWTSSNTKILTVDAAKGVATVVSGAASGKVRLTAKCANRTMYFDVQVMRHAQSLDTSPSYTTLKLKRGKTVTLTGTFESSASDDKAKLKWQIEQTDKFLAVQKSTKERYYYGSFAGTQYTFYARMAGTATIILTNPVNGSEKRITVNIVN